MTTSAAAPSSNFLAKRFIRIYPIYAVVSIILLAAYVAAPSPEMSHKGDFAVLFESFLLLPAPRHVVGVAWTLVYELWFYLLFGLLYFRSPRFFFVALGAWTALAWTRVMVGWSPSILRAWLRTRSNHERIPARLRGVDRLRTGTLPTCRPGAGFGPDRLLGRLVGGARRERLPAGCVGAVAVLAAALALCCAFYRWVERPLLDACRRRLPR